MKIEFELTYSKLLIKKTNTYHKRKIVVKNEFKNKRTNLGLNLIILSNYLPFSKDIYSVANKIYILVTTLVTTWNFIKDFNCL